MKPNSSYKAYIYPISSRFHGQTHNPYLENFVNILSGYFHFVNKDVPSKIGVLDIYRYIFKLDYIFMHWPEDMVERKLGYMQALGFFLLIPLCRLRKIKLIYVVHNKISHTKHHYLLKKQIAMSLIKNGSMITHSREGISFIEDLGKKKKDIFYFPHPVDPGLYTPQERNIDILIWGNISPYKGIHKFLEILKKNQTPDHWKITIAGRISSKAYMADLMALKKENVQIINTFLDDNCLSQLISGSKIVLFPYQKTSILSSGAFAKTLAYPVHIIGPDCGAFNDFRHLENVHTFKDHNELLDLINSILLSEHKDNKLYQDSFSYSNKLSWEKFGEAFRKYFLNS